ncbi:MAG: DDE-type integrase/transposase/recombinase [Burkholderiaceae bacterium]|nr:DDE-type integrase/transposase/recombinase [Burkholderiaceae bacterium]
MAGFGLRKNMVFDWGGVGFRIDRLQSNGDVLLERVDDGCISIVQCEKLLAEYCDGNISASASVHDSVSPTFSRPLDELPQEVQQEVARRRHYLQAILAHGQPIFTKDYLQPLILGAAAEIGDEKPPGATSIYRWFRRYRQNEDTRALIPRFDRRGSRNVKQSDKFLQFAAEAIEEAFKASPHATGPSIYTRLIAKIEAENRALRVSEQIKRPCLRTLYRLITRVEAYDHAVLKEGKIAADKRYRLVKTGVKTERILERVEIDHTPLDLFLIDEKSLLPLGRPTLTVVVDHFSRMLLGFHLSFDNPSTGAVMGALRHAILPKASVKESLPNLKTQHQWDCYGRPDVMVVDNGLEFHGNDLESVAYDLGIRIQFCPKRQPRFKGAVERFLKTINYSFAHQLPGTSLARWHLRGDYDPLKFAVLTLGEFHQIFQKWVTDVYAQTIHRGTHETPWARWHEGLQRRQPELPESAAALQRRIGHIEERSLRQDGILLNGIRYNGDALAPILRAYGAGTKVRVLYDHDDLGDIQVWGPDDADPVSVLALNQTYAKGLTALQNGMIRAAAREKGESQQDAVALERAKHDIITTVENLMTSRKQRDRRRAATIDGLSTSKSGTPLSTEKNLDQRAAAGKRVKSVRPAGLALPISPDDEVSPPVAYSFFRPKQKSSEEGIR